MISPTDLKLSLGVVAAMKAKVPLNSAKKEFDHAAVELLLTCGKGYQLQVENDPSSDESTEFVGGKGTFHCDRYADAWVESLRKVAKDDKEMTCPPIANDQAWNEGIELQTLVDTLDGERKRCEAGAASEPGHYRPCAVTLDDGVLVKELGKAK